MKINYIIVDIVIFFLASMAAMIFYFPSISIYYFLFWVFILQFYVFNEYRKIIEENQKIRNKRLEKIKQEITHDTKNQIQEHQEVINLCKKIRKNKINYVPGSNSLH